MSEQPDPVLGMPLQPPGSDRGNTAWREAMAGKRQLLRDIGDRRG